MKKKLSALLLVCTCMVMLLGTNLSCFAASTASDSADWRANLTTVAEGKLTVATSPDFAPYEFYSIAEDGTPTLSGFDMGLAQYIADYMGLELEVVTVDFDGVLSELQTKSVDLGMAGLSPSEERKKIMDFSDNYYMGGQALVTVSSLASEITGLDVVNDPSYTVGAQTGSIQLSLAQEFAADANIVSLPKVTDIISELISGKEQAAFIEKDVALCYQQNYPELTIVCDVPYDTEGSAIGVCKGNEALLAGVNEAIAAAIADNSMNQFVADANELATGKTYEGLLVEGQVPGTSAESAETTDITKPEAHEYEGLTTIADGKLTVATSPDFAPYEFYSIADDGTPTLAGFDMAMAQYIADYLGLELEVVTVDFDGVLSELQTKSVDLGMAGLSPSAEREAIMDFSDIYYQGGQGLVTVTSLADTITSLEDVNNSDYTVGAQTGSIQLDLANEYAADANIVSLPKVTDIISELISGKEDAAFLEMDVAKCYQQNYPELTIVCEVPYETKGSAIGVCKGNEVLLGAVNDAIAEAVASGAMAQFTTEAYELATGKTYEGLLENMEETSAGTTEEVEEADAADLSAAVEAETESGGFIRMENFKTVAKYSQLFVQGVIVTVLLSIFTVLIGFVLALILALMRLSNFRPLRFLALNEEGFEEDGGIKAAIGKFNPLSFLATAYVEILRSTPVIVQVFIIYYGVFGSSGIQLPNFTIFGFIQFARFLPGVVALGMNSGAYLCEIIRSGIQSVDGGQTEASRSLGMSSVQTLRYIVLPQALTNILPAIANEFVVIIKESSITYTIGVQDIMSAVNAVKGATFVITEPLLVATALYFCLCFPTSKLIAYFERRMSRGNKR